MIFDLFQFHKGTIKADSFYGVVPNSQLFQFHKGTIKAVLCVVLVVLFIYFNSIKVQLKPFGCLVILHFSSLFQFHKGTIKAYNAEQTQLARQISIP